MKKFTSLLIISILVVSAISIIGCTGKNSGFNFIFKHGIGPEPKNELNTFKGKYTKDMVSDPSVTTKMVLTEEELDRILQKMKDIDFFNYPDEFSLKLAPDSPIGLVTPYARYYFKVEYEGNVKELWWADEIVWRDKWLRDSKEEIIFENKEEAERLYELISLIRGIIENKPEYKELPEPTGGYM